MTPTGPRGRLVPAYLVTRGRPQPAGPPLDRLSVLHAATPTAAPHLGGEHQRVLQLLQPGALSVAETAAHLGLPVSATMFLAGDLIACGALNARAPIPDSQQLDRSLLERVLRGLRQIQ